VATETGDSPIPIPRYHVGMAATDERTLILSDGSLADADLPTLLRRLIDDNAPVAVHYIAGHWLDVDDAFDLASARNLV